MDLFFVSFLELDHMVYFAAKNLDDMHYLIKCISPKIELKIKNVYTQKTWGYEYCIPLIVEASEKYQEGVYILRENADELSLEKGHILCDGEYFDGYEYIPINIRKHFLDEFLKTFE